MIQLDIPYFLEHHWQKQPLVIRQGLPNFKDTIDEHELAGLAQEDEVDSRVIAKQDSQWNVQLGPIDDFTRACQGDWTLLVRGVEAYCEQSAALLDPFRFIPDWRIDDLMVSFSVANAGVGPHLDQYDVFIIQGKGRRRWQVGPNHEYPAVSPHPLLSQVSGFEPIIDEVLHPGDIIYIPPGFPHNGVALEDCLNYSIGFRAPTATELTSQFADYLIDLHIDGHRYSDPELTERDYSSEIKQQEISKLQSMVSQMINSDHFSNFLLKSTTENSDYAYEEGEEIDPQTIIELLNGGHILRKLENVKTSFVEKKSPEALLIGVNGEVYEYQEENSEKLKNLLTYNEFKLESKLNYKNSSHFAQIVSKLVSNGWWHFKQ